MRTRAVSAPVFAVSPLVMMAAARRPGGERSAQQTDVVVAELMPGQDAAGLQMLAARPAMRIAVQRLAVH
jgi:hypothetical protein